MNVFYYFSLTKQIEKMFIEIFRSYSQIEIQIFTKLMEFKVGCYNPQHETRNSQLVYRSSQFLNS
jgi:hypothetical protein